MKMRVPNVTLLIIAIVYFVSFANVHALPMKKGSFFNRQYLINTFTKLFFIYLDDPASLNPQPEPPGKV